jgi:hypothetical protein
MTIIPVTQTIVDWTKFVSTINEMTDRSPTRLLDQSNLAVGDSFSFVSSVAFFCSELGPFEGTKYSPNVFKHLLYGFLIDFSKDQYLDVLRETELICSDNYESDDDEKIILVSGNLLQWKNAIVIFSSEHWNKKIRTIFNALYVFFLQKNLGIMFESYAQKQLEGGTFILREI